MASPDAISTDNTKLASGLRSRSVRPSNHLQPVWMAALLLIETFILFHAYSFPTYCIDILSYRSCLLPSQIVLRTTAFFAVLALIVFARPKIRALLFRDDRPKTVALKWACVQIAGFCLIMLPWAVASRSQELMNLALVPWTVGPCLFVLGLALAVAGPERWRLIVAEFNPALLALLAVPLLFPLGTRDLWNFQPLTRVTFEGVEFVLKVFGVEAIAEPTKYVVSSNSFSIEIGTPCSGVEGFALTMLFFGCYFLAFKESLRFPNVWVLLPIGLLLSWGLNVVRIATLFAIGHNGNPKLAVTGFHSYAGWLMFSILAFAIIGVSTSVPWFRRDNTAPLPLLEDWTAARILPFAAFMGAALLISTFTVTPDLWYFAKAVAIAFVLADLLSALSRAPGLANRHSCCGGRRCNRVALDCFRFSRPVPSICSRQCSRFAASQFMARLGPGTIDRNNCTGASGRRAFFSWLFA